jgi:hypothetical protein
MQTVKILVRSKVGRILEVHEACSGSPACCVELRMSDLGRKDQHGNLFEIEMHLDASEAAQLISAVGQAQAEHREASKPPAQVAYEAWAATLFEQPPRAFENLIPTEQAAWKSVAEAVACRMAG